MRGPQTGPCHPWTDADIAACSMMWRRGESSRMIAIALNRTRNSVVGKMYRLRVPRLRSPFPDGLPKYDYKSGHRSASRSQPWHPTRDAKPEWLRRA